MTILITGGTGLIGRHLLSALPAGEAIVLTRSPQRAHQTVNSDQHQVRFITSLDEIAADQQLSAVVNLAGEPIADKRWTAKRKQQIEQSRWATTEHLLALFSRLEQPPGCFISGSAVGYYGRQGDKIISEAHDSPFDEFSHRLCKRWEEIALGAEQMAIRTCLLRTGIVLSEQGGALQKMLPPFRFGLGGKMASGEQYMPWIHIADMVAAIQFLLNTPDCHGAYNLCSPSPVTNAEFTRTLGEVLHRPSILPMPTPMLRLLFGEMADLLIYGQRCIPARLQQAGFRFRFAHLSEALNDLLEK